MKRFQLTAEKRDHMGHQAKKVRTEGKIPGTVYGKNVTSVSVSIPQEAFETLYKEAGETGVIELVIGQEKRPVLVHTIQRDARSGAMVHIEFHQVNLSETVHANVPLRLVGESPAVLDKSGVLLTLLSEIEVEALPMDLPEAIEVDVSALAAVDSEIKVSDLPVPAKVTFVTDGAAAVVRIGALVSKESVEEAAAPVAAATPEGEAAPAEGATEPAAEAEKTEEK